MPVNKGENIITAKEPVEGRSERVFILNASLPDRLNMFHQLPPRVKMKRRAGQSPNTPFHCLNYGQQSTLYDAVPQQVRMLIDVTDNFCPNIANVLLFFHPELSDKK